jgi:TRAP transporter 4TM/12TM fusion protein
MTSLGLFNRKSTEPVEIDLALIDRESAYRRYTGWKGQLTTILLFCFTTFQLFASITGRIPQQQVRYTHLGFAICLAYWLYPARKKGNREKATLMDLFLCFTFLGVVIYGLTNYVALQSRAGAFFASDVYVGAIAILLVLEAGRRVVGFPIVIIAITFTLYARFGANISGIFRHRGYTTSRIITHLFYTVEGIIGTPIAVCSTFIFLFILFGAFLEKTGIGQFFIDIANALAGWSAGGPAKVAVLSSALLGTVSGSSVANTVSTGSFTIPLMKSLGYTPEFAGAVEAAASTGGQIMPPIMGAAAFMISEAVGVPYLTVAAAAVIPAVLYFTGIWIMVHLEAKRLGLKGLPRDQLPNGKVLMLTKGHLLLPIVAIVGFLLSGFTMTRAAIYGILTCVFIPFLRKETRIPLMNLFDAYINGARNIISVACACGVAGIIIGMVTLTGLGIKLGNSLISLTGGNMLLTLFFTMITSIVLGMGVPTIANYLITSTIAAPILIQIGIPALAAHMFCFYFGIIADITPPVALAAYAGSAIAKGNPFWTGVTASKLAIAAFIVPYLFVLNPEMILINATPLNLVQIVFTSLVGMLSIGAGLTGFLIDHSPKIERILLVLSGFGMLIPGTYTDLIGAALLIAIFMLQRARIKKRTGAAA